MALGRAFFMFQLVAIFGAHRGDDPDGCLAAGFDDGAWRRNAGSCHRAELMIR